MTLKKDAKFEEKLTHGLKNEIRASEHLKVSKLELSWDRFIENALV